MYGMQFEQRWKLILELDACCEKFLEELGTNPPPPTVRCNTCDREITYYRTKLETSFDEEKNVVAGWSIECPEYV